MCIGVPAQITAITPGPMPMATLRAAGETRTACLAYVPEAGVGDWVYVQLGFATVVLTEQEAQESLAALGELAAVADAPSVVVPTATVPGPQRAGIQAPRTHSRGAASLNPHGPSTATPNTSAVGADGLPGAATPSPTTTH